jgi:hypothetical protein
MDNTILKPSLAIGYVALLAGIAPFLPLDSAAAWLTFVTVTLAPLCVVAAYWKVPSQTMSESIQAARR